MKECVCVCVQKRESGGGKMRESNRECVCVNESGRRMRGEGA